MNTIVVLGDSSSMAVGLDRCTYPFLLSQKTIWPEDTIFINGSSPGFTSAGINALFQNSRITGKINAILLYIGNNDGVMSETPHGRYTLRKKLLQKFSRTIYPKMFKKVIPITISPFEWNVSFDSIHQRGENPRDYYYNLNHIAAFCRHRSIPLLLIKPRANKLFPAGLGKGNFMFYKYIGIYDNTAHLLAIADSRFIQALTLHEQGKYSDACKIYYSILQNPIQDMSEEYPLVVVSNYAAALVEQGDLSQAELLLNSLLKEKNCRIEIVLYNLAQIYKRENNRKKYQLYLSQAYSHDRSIYRVQEEFRVQLDMLAKNYPRTIHLIDMEHFIADDNFIDYCHVDKQGHVQIINRLISLFKKVGIKGTSKALLQNLLPNPEFARGITDDLYTYIGVYKDNATIRFADFFSIKDVIPYLRIAQKEKFYSKFFDTSVLLRTPDELYALLPQSFQRGIVPAEEIDVKDKYLLTLSLNEIKTELSSHVAGGNQIYNRLKTTIYWYFRESLRFGFQSRISMRYDRVFLEQLAQRLCMVWVINKKLKCKFDAKITQYIKYTKQAEAIHELYCRQFSLTRDCSKLLQAYDADLRILAKKIKAV